jgi:PhoPQ-activated pathogenicity-related protein
MNDFKPKKRWEIYFLKEDVHDSFIETQKSSKISSKKSGKYFKKRWKTLVLKSSLK